ncbi:MAG TPA: organomercurial lyase [Smithellaceae bacterium]|nr:organomercurial lyase [Smithellaceae bacterium]HQF84682.1 organomercurial lyase [Smithellaceae bacterium]HQG80968.1 organomercurial lyase [Smithellaceae bacterium]
MAVCWLFPGKTVVIDTPCLDCGEPIHLEVKDGVILKVEPVETIGYVAVPFARWWENVSYA